MGLADNVDIMALIGSDTQLTKVANTRSGEYKGPCPKCGGVDRFIVWPADNLWSCRVCFGNNVPPQDAITYLQRTRGLSFKAALETLKLTDDNGRYQVTPSKRVYRDLADYAKAKDVPLEFFEKYQWADVTWQKRPGAEYPTFTRADGKTQTIMRVRFFDGKKPYFKPQKTKQPIVLYGLKTALEIHKKTGLPLVLVNGEPSTIAGHYRNTPAFCKTGGEVVLPANLIEELKLVYKHEVILIAPDNDSAGKDFADKNSAALTEAGYRAGILDMGLSDSGDYADFCMLYQEKTAQEISARIPVTVQVATDAHSAAKRVLAFAQNKIQLPGRPLPFPFPMFNEFDGHCRILPPRMMALIFAMSGHGKTSWLETACEYWMKRGYCGIYDGREFSPEIYHFRRVQRWAGQRYEPLEGDSYTLDNVSYTDFLLHQKWQQEQRDNTPGFLREGVQLVNKQVASIKWVDNMVSQWPGKLHYAPHFGYVEDLLLWMANHIQSDRKAGRFVDFAVFDYLHLYRLDKTRTASGAENDYMSIINLIKDFCQTSAVFGIVAAQVNKVADSNARLRNRPLTIGDARYINDQHFNLTIALNIMYSKQKAPDGSLALDWKGKYVWDKATLENGNQPAMTSIIKNTAAKTGFKLQQAQFKHYCFLNLPWSLDKIDLNEDD